MDIAGMGLLSWIAIGLVAGILGKFLLPGKDPGGCFLTTIIGIVGALVGGAIATALGYGGVSGFDLRSVGIATVGAILFQLVLRLVRGDKK
jgi:uncharacterized membrane protein YeaQ/YmgE (transglycosylase-associated protein family)